MKNKVYTKGRKWLNPIDSCNSGAIQYKVTADAPYKEGVLDICAELNIWDCSKKISLDFSIWEDSDAKKVAQKIQILQDALQDIKVGLGKAYEDSMNSEIGDDE